MDKQERFTSLREVVASFRPDGARGYRLVDVDGNRYPGEDQQFLVCGGRVEVPAVRAGNYRILFYDKEDRLIPGESGTPDPQVEIDRDLRVLTSPAEFDEAEQYRTLRIERRQLSNRGFGALTRTISALSQSMAQRDHAHADAMRQIQATIIDREQSQADVMRQVVEMQKDLAGLHHRMVQENAERTRASAEAEAKLRATLEESIAKNQTRSDWANVANTAVKEVSAVAQVLMLQAGSRAMPEGKERAAAESGGKLPSTSRPTALPPTTAAQAATDTPKVAQEGADKSKAAPSGVTGSDDDEGDWFLSFFGLTDKASAPPSAAQDAPAPKSKTEPRGNIGEPSPAKATTATGDTADATPAPEQAGSPARTADPADRAADAALRALDDMVAMLDGAAAQLPPVEARPVEPWSPAWAWRQIKRRMMSLSEARIAWLTSSRYHVLDFLRELGALARPPTQMIPSMLAMEGAG